MQYEQLSLYSPVDSDDMLGSVFDQALRTLVKKSPTPKVQARFYPYAGLSSTIRLREGCVYERVSDVLSGSPREVLFALACILVAKLYRMKTPKTYERIYRSHTLDPSVLDATHSVRRKRGYKITTSPKGKTYDLNELFAELNALYFNNQLERPVLSWSPRKTRRVLGHHDHVHDAIVVSNTLDSAKIPRFVVEFVLYHEMLHMKHPPRVVSGRTVYHGRRFREDEQRFEQLGKALAWLDKAALSEGGAVRKAVSPRRQKRGTKS